MLGIWDTTNNFLFILFLIQQFDFLMQIQQKLNDLFAVVKPWGT